MFLFPLRVSAVSLERQDFFSPRFLRSRTGLKYLHPGFFRRRAFRPSQICSLQMGPESPADCTNTAEAQQSSASCPLRLPPVFPPKQPPHHHPLSINAVSIRVILCFIFSSSSLLFSLIDLAQSLKSVLPITLVLLFHFLPLSSSSWPPPSPLFRDAVVLVAGFSGQRENVWSRFCVCRLLK